MGGLVIGIILILVGVSALTGISLFNFIIAIVLIAIGIRMIAGRSMGGPGSWQWHHHGGPDPHHGHGTVSSGDNRIDEVAVFSSLNKAFTGNNFKGGKIVAVFSSAEIDLTGVTAGGSSVGLEVSSVFSSVEITIPKSWNVRSSASMFLGNVDTHQAPDGDGSVTLTLRGEAVFGEIEIRK
jgi:predicted membrane protein